MFNFCCPKTAYGPNCELEGEAAHTGVKNKGLSFKIIAKDYKVHIRQLQKKKKKKKKKSVNHFLTLHSSLQGRRRVNGGDLFEVSMVKESADDIYQVETFIKDHKDGTYVRSYMPQSTKVICLLSRIAGGIL